MTVLVHPVEREVPHEWAAELRSLFPRIPGKSYLELVWEPGYPWEPVNRWIVYEMHPASSVDAEVLRQLERDTPPQGYWDGVLEEFVPEDGNLITRRAWRMFKDSGHWGKPFWIIQGTKGGHQRWLSETERKLLAHIGLPTDTAAPGDLPYAEWDRRVVEALTRHDLLRNEHGRLDMSRTLGLGAMRERERTALRTLREKVVNHLREQVEEVGAEVNRALNHSDGRRGHQSDQMGDADEAESNYIETGRTDGLIT